MLKIKTTVFRSQVAYYRSQPPFHATPTLSIQKRFVNSIRQQHAASETKCASGRVIPISTSSKSIRFEKNDQATSKDMHSPSQSSNPSTYYKRGKLYNTIRMANYTTSHLIAWGVGVEKVEAEDWGVYKSRNVLKG